jgi:acetolactate synthase-1/2/3 large subunit
MRQLRCLFAHNDLLLLASCPHVASNAGGLLAFNGVDVERIDSLSTTGLCLAEDRLCRLLWADDHTNGRIEFLSYDAGGVDRYFRIDDLSEPHDIAWNGREFVVVSTGNNSVLRVSSTGTVTGQWKAPGTGDAWHLNSLLLTGASVLVAAFGKFGHHREWTRHDTTGTGMVFDLGTGQSILTGLSCPHNPRFFDGAWSVCNSKTGELLQIDPVTTMVRRRVQLHGWTRGVAVSEDYVFVGVSARRHDGAHGDQGSIAVVCRKTWTVLEQFPIPCREIYDLVLVPADLLGGLHRGFCRQRGAPASEPPDQVALCQKAPRGSRQLHLATTP